MKYEKLNIGWNAEPNAPEVELSVEGDKLNVTFYLNPFIYDNHDEDKGELLFTECFTYSFNTCNDEEYYGGQYRYNNDTLPWGEFYELQHDWERDLPNDFKTLNPEINKQELRHFIFFFRDNTLECIAKSFKFRQLKG